VVDGQVAAAVGLPGKPDPATFRYAAALLDVPAAGCVVVEDAVSGVQAGSAGNFRAVIGVDRGAGHQTLLDAGATFVVDDLDDLL
jgi:beta-phosphoglucomutase-like phosphatase (HAD superfamily)